MSAWHAIWEGDLEGVLFNLVCRLAITSQTQNISSHIVPAGPHNNEEKECNLSADISLQVQPLLISLIRLSV